MLSKILGRVADGRRRYFDQAFYLRVYRDVAEARIDAFAHYMQFGWREGRNPSPVFHSLYYKDKHLAPSGLAVNPLDHYQRIGHARRMSTAPESEEELLELQKQVVREYFDESYYCYSYADLNGVDPLDHYLRWGWHEGRDPVAGFHTVEYLKVHPHIRILKVSPFYHFVSTNQNARPERRHRPHVEPVWADDAELLNSSNLFSAEYYLQQYPDVKAAQFDPAEHFLRYGWREAREPSPVFSAARYLAENPDVRAAGVNPLVHWLRSGQSENRPFPCAEKFGELPFADVEARIGAARVFREYLNRELDAQFFHKRYEHILPPQLAGDSVKIDALCDFYLKFVKEYSLDPNSWFSEKDYLTLNEDVKSAVEAGAFLCGFHHWVLHGQTEQRRCRRFNEDLRISLRRVAIRVVFDADYYSRKFMAESSRRVAEDEAIEHFYSNGLAAGIVPVPSEIFDEEFYTAYYQDVKKAKDEGYVPSGYFHYVHTGLEEGRIPTHDLEQLIRIKLGDLATPVGFQKLHGLRDRLRPVPMRISSKQAPVFNIFIPSLDPDIMFGGYIAFLHFLCRLAENGNALRFLIMDDSQSNRDWFLRGIASRPRWAKIFAQQQIINIANKLAQVNFSYDDICIAYSCWTMHDAWSVAHKLRIKSVIFFIQEYEPIFHELDCFHFSANSAYRIPHIAIFNSKFLTRYFEREKIGVFSAKGTGKYLQFDHVIGNLGPDAARAGDRRTRKRLLCYARPEKHAGRNLFEICVIALSAAVRKGIFEGDWEFVGIGTFAGGHLIDLGPGKKMTLLPRIVQHKYEALLQTFDVGLSLMWAPHPGVLHFEMAKAGIVTVTNVYGERTAEALSEFGHNIVPCEPSIDDIVEGLRIAVQRSCDWPARIRGSQIPAPADWDAVFSSSFFEELHQLIPTASVSPETAINAENQPALSQPIRLRKSLPDVYAEGTASKIEASISPSRSGVIEAG